MFHSRHRNFRVNSWTQYLQNSKFSRKFLMQFNVYVNVSEIRSYPQIIFARNSAESKCENFKTRNESDSQHTLLAIFCYFKTCDFLLSYFISVNFQLHFSCIKIKEWVSSINVQYMGKWKKNTDKTHISYTSHCSFPKAVIIFLLSRDII